MKFKLLIILLAFFVQSSFVLHPINISVGDITYKDKKLHLKFKFFTDDLQASLTQYSKVPMDIVNKGIDGNTRKYIEKYVAANFSMDVNNKPLKWVYKNAYLKDAVVYVEYETNMENVKSMKTAKIKNTLLFESLPEQKNIINIKLTEGGDLKVLSFDNDPEEYVQEVSF